MNSVVTTTGRVHRLVDGWADRLHVTAGKHGPEYIDGVNALRKVILDSLDVGEFGDPEQRDVMEDVRQFCTSHCPEAEQDGPGRATRCIRCPLKYHALSRYEETAEELAREAREERLAESQETDDEPSD